MFTLLKPMDDNSNAVRLKKRRDYEREYIESFIDRSLYKQRICAYRGCGQKLSMYNLNKVCNYHAKQVMKDKKLRTVLGNDY
jgi:hypothetical protein